MARKIIVTLIRNDLRTHDHAVFHAVHSQVNSDVTHMLPLYVFDERNLELSGLPGYVRQGPEAKTRLCGFWRSGVFRTRFLTEGVYDLRDRLRKLDSNLLIRFGKAEEVALNIVEALRANGDEVKGVYLQKEHSTEELNVERRLEASLRKIRVPLMTFDTKALVHPDDLSFKVSHTPDVFTPYRKKVESLGPLGRKTFTMPSKFKPFPNPTPGSKPSTATAYGNQFDNKSVEDLLPFLLSPLKLTHQAKYIGSEMPRSEFSAIPFKGGETAALERLNQYFHQGSPPPVAKYKETRNGLIGHEYSTKFSTFLAHGMLSPRLIMESLDSHEAKFGESDNTYWVRFELLWRDYFILIGEKFGSNLFKLGGLEAVTDPRESRIKTAPGWWKDWDTSLGKNQVINKWIEGRTGVPFIDANMIELRETGYMSNRGRQNVASFLTKDLGYDWRIGAELFESLLIDHDPTSNWGNWTYVGGVGNDPRASRQFNPIKQAHDYDPHGSYIKIWLPQLALLPMNKIQIPWTLVPTDRAQYVKGGEEAYPFSPVVEQSHWKPHYQRGANLKGHNKLNGNPSERVKGLGPRGGAPKVDEGGDGGGGNNRGGGGGGGQRGGRGGGRGGGGNRGLSSSSSRGRGGSTA